MTFTYNYPNGTSTSNANANANANAGQGRKRTYEDHSHAHPVKVQKSSHHDSANGISYGNNHGTAHNASYGNSYQAQQQQNGIQGAYHRSYSAHAGSIGSTTFMGNTTMNHWANRTNSGSNASSMDGRTHRIHSTASASSTNTSNYGNTAVHNVTNTIANKGNNHPIRLQAQQQHQQQQQQVQKQFNDNTFVRHNSAPQLNQQFQHQSRPSSANNNVHTNTNWTNQRIEMKHNNQWGHPQQQQYNPGSSRPTTPVPIPVQHFPTTTTGMTSHAPTTTNFRSTTNQHHIQSIQPITVPSTVRDSPTDEDATQPDPDDEFALSEDYDDALLTLLDEQEREFTLSQSVTADSLAPAGGIQTLVTAGKSEVSSKVFEVQNNSTFKLDSSKESITRCESIDATLFQKDGEIKILRETLNKLQSENITIKETFSSQLRTAEQTHETVRKQLEREIERLKVELEFKAQEQSLESFRRSQSLNVQQTTSPSKTLETKGSFPTTGCFFKGEIKKGEIEKAVAVVAPVQVESVGVNTDSIPTVELPKPSKNDTDESEKQLQVMGYTAYMHSSSSRNISEKLQLRLFKLLSSFKAGVVDDIKVLVDTMNRVVRVPVIRPMTLLEPLETSLEYAIKCQNMELIEWILGIVELVVDSDNNAVKLVLSDDDHLLWSRLCVIFRDATKEVLRHRGIVIPVLSIISLLASQRRQFNSPALSLSAIFDVDTLVSIVDAHDVDLFLHLMLALVKLSDDRKVYQIVTTSIGKEQRPVILYKIVSWLGEDMNQNQDGHTETKDTQRQRKIYLTRLSIIHMLSMFCSHHHGAISLLIKSNQIIHRIIQCVHYEVSHLARSKRTSSTLIDSPLTLLTSSLHLFNYLIDRAPTLPNISNMYGTHHLFIEAMGILIYGTLSNKVGKDLVEVSKYLVDVVLPDQNEVLERVYRDGSCADDGVG